ncbi:MAG: uroporphyrinogen decarboxylase [Caldilineae bacterium]|nr:uroporphyrinogen decarboxylase [Caldilineae bacterium]
MFVQPENWSKLSPTEKREARFAAWMSTEGRQFASPDAESEYKLRTQRIKDVIDLKEPDRVPITPFVGGYFAKYGGITPYEVMYDYDKYTVAWHKFNEAFEPDYLVFSGAFNPGKVYDILGYQVYRWPGGSLSKNVDFQCLEVEYMLADEYDDFIADPESFYMRTYMPRAFSALQGFGMLPTFFASMELPMAPALMIPAGLPPVQQSLKAFMEAGLAALEYAEASGKADGYLQATYGMPALPGGFTKAPFDYIGDTIRGTRGIMLDMFRQPTKVQAAVERLVPIAVKLGVQTATVNNNPFVFIPLHKGADGFMSDADFRKFYWPTYKAVLEGLIAEGLVPWNLVEGGYNSRLAVIAEDHPAAGATYWNFDQTDMTAAKKYFGDWAAIAGNVPSSLLHTGTPEDVATYVKGLIDTAGKDGGYALATGAVLDHTTAENLHAMFTTGKEYGVY